MKNNKIIIGFNNWTTSLEFYKLGFLVGMILIQGCILAPLALFSMNLAGFSDIQLALIVFSSFAILISNLSVQPLKISLLIFLTSAFLELSVIIYNTISILGN